MSQSEFVRYRSMPGFVIERHVNYDRARLRRRINKTATRYVYLAFFDPCKGRCPRDCRTSELTGKYLSIGACLVQRSPVDCRIYRPLCVERNEWRIYTHEPETKRNRWYRVGTFIGLSDTPAKEIAASLLSARERTLELRMQAFIRTYTDHAPEDVADCLEELQAGHALR